MSTLHPNPLTKRFLTGVVKERPDRVAWRAQYKGTTLLPMRQVPAYNLEWDVVSDENGLAGFYARNGIPIPGPEDLPFATKYQEVKNLMAMRTLQPEDVMILREAGEIGISKVGDNMRAKAQQRLVKKIGACDDEVDATVEYMIMQALQGSITWPPRDVNGNPIVNRPRHWGDLDMVINFPMRASFVQSVSSLVGYLSRAGGGVVWTDPDNSDPVLDLAVIAELISKTIGINGFGSRIIMSSALLSRLCFNKKVIDWIKGTEFGVRMVNIGEFQTWLKTAFGYTIETYDAMWTYRTNETSEAGPTINAVPFLGEWKALIIPPGAELGYFGVAPSPDGKYEMDKYTWIKEPDEPPWEWRVGEGLVGFPVVQRPGEIFILDAGS